MEKIKTMIEDGKCNAIEMGFGLVLVVMIVVGNSVDKIIKSVKTLL